MKVTRLGTRGNFKCMNLEEKRNEVQRLKKSLLESQKQQRRCGNRRDVGRTLALVTRH